MGDYTVCKVQDNEFKRFLNCYKDVPEDQIENGGKHMLLYEVKPEIKGELPSVTDKVDSNNGVSSDWTRLIINMCTLEKQSNYYGNKYRQKKTLPRMLWINKSWTLEKLHYEVFDYFRQIFADWIDADETK